MLPNQLENPPPGSDPGTISEFVERMIPAILKTGRYAREAQGTVPNVEKNDFDSTGDDPEFIRRRGRAKTIIDERAQEMLLAAAREAFPYPFRIDAEEDTPLRTSLHTESAPTTLVIDPIDGTLEYVEGGNGYSINVALLGSGKVFAMLCYFPAKESLYLLDADHVPYICRCSYDEIAEKQELRAPGPKPAKKVYANNRVPDDAVARISTSHEVVRDVDGVVKWPEALLGCISGEYCTAIFVRPQIRDVLIGAMIESLPGGYAKDFSGRAVAWPDGDRIPEAIFGFGEPPEDVRAALAEQKPPH